MISNNLHFLDIPDLDEDAFKPRSGRLGRGSMRLYGGGKGGGSAPAPDPQIGASAMANVELGKDWLSFAKEQFADGNERQAATDALNTKVINQQLATQDQANTWAQQDRERTLNTFQPVEDAFVKTAQEYDTPEKQADMITTVGRGPQVASRIRFSSMGVRILSSTTTPSGAPCEVK